MDEYFEGGPLVSQEYLSFSANFPKKSLVNTVVLKNSHNKQAQEDKSLIDLNNDYKKLAVRGQAKAKIIQFVKKFGGKTLAKSRSKMIKSPLILYTLSQYMSKDTSQKFIENVDNFAHSHQAFLEIFR